MSENRKPAYSKRCLISHRPPFRTGEPVFYRCPVCGELFIRNSPSPLPDFPGNAKEESGPLPRVYCCGKELQPLVPLEGEQVPEGHEITFTVFGGFNDNAVRIAVDEGSHPMTEDHRIEWIYYRSFQGGQLKYLPPKGRSIAIFAFADEDAFVYCDREVCRMSHEHCQFCCKRGNLIYAWCSEHGLIKLMMNGF